MLFQIEHEIRSMTHPLYARPLVNRNPAQTNRNYVWGGDEWVWSLPDTVGPSGPGRGSAEGAEGPDDRQTPRTARPATGDVTATASRIAGEASPAEQAIGERSSRADPLPASLRSAPSLAARERVV